MAFCTAYKSALEKNIRNLYSGLPADRYVSQKKGNATMIEYTQRTHGYQLKPTPNDMYLKSQLEYSHEYESILPKAPAYRKVSAEELSDIIQRVTRPTYSSKSCHRDQIRQKKEMCAHCVYVTSEEPLASLEVRQINRRLSRPTTATLIRNRLTRPLTGFSSGIRNTSGESYASSRRVLSRGVPYKNDNNYAIDAVYDTCSVRPCTRTGLHSATGDGRANIRLRSAPCDKRTVRSAQSDERT